MFNPIPFIIGLCCLATAIILFATFLRLIKGDSDGQD